MKKSLFTVLLFLAATAVMAVPAKRGLWKTITLSNGTEVSVELKGDEHVHYLQAADGTCYVRNGNGYELIDSEALQVRRAKRQMKRRVIASSTSDGLGKYQTMSMGAVPSIGEYTIPVVMVQFSDLKFKSTTTVQKMTRYYNEEGYNDESDCVGSVRDYFKAQSGGMFVPTFDVVGIVTLDHPYSYYGKNDEDGNDEGLDYLPGDVTSAAVEQLGVDFSKYVVPAGDSNHTKGVPLLAMFYAGRGEATESETEANAKLLWPCEWDGTDDPVAQGTYQGVHFNSFFIGNELDTGGRSLMGMGVFCHEFGHALGLPDFYVTDYSYEGDDAFGLWSIMDGGAYVNDSRAPVGYTAYEKSYMGWLDLPEIDAAGDVTLQLPEGKSEQSAYIMRNSSNETFIFENRQPGTWYPSSFGSGVMVTRVAYSRYQWLYNTLNNTQTKKRACMLTADGAKLDFSAQQSNLYGNSKKTIATLKTYNGGTMTVNMTGITKNADGTLTMTFGQGSTDPGTDPSDPVDGMLFYESFDDCNGMGANDGRWNGQIANGSFLADNVGWEAEKAFGANQCAKFGTGSVTGSATTPTFTLNGSTTLTFRAGAWNASGDGTSLNLLVSGGTAEPAVVVMQKGAFTDYVVTISAEGRTSITFESSKGRFFLDEVKVYSNTASNTYDVNGDGKVDALDIQAVINTSAEGSNTAKHDVNGDGKVDALDIQDVINAAAAGE